MTNNITEIQLLEKKIDELTSDEMMFVHLSTSYSPITVKNAILRSNLSFIYQNIQHSLSNEYSKQLIPYISLCAILDQLGTCYNRKDKSEPRFQNGIKRCLYYLGEFSEDDEIIDVIYALRNGLLHNVSLSSYIVNKNKFYHFRYNKDINGIYEPAENAWDGNYETLDTGRERYTTSINVENFRDMVFGCLSKAQELNQNSQLELRLDDGTRQLFFDYVRSIPK
ncbi:hypothetical protein [Psychroserpens sp. S379A]|uniref:hypothetical protein n=1 Tax=Psychroserpens sp. S379A TaxID=3415137 RepID=UPI003C799222